MGNGLFTIIGVLPPEADSPKARDLGQPLRADPEKGHGGLGTMAMGLLKRSVTPVQACEDLTVIHQGWIQQHPEKEVTALPVVTPLRELYGRQLKEFRSGTSILLVIVGFVLLIACCNVMSIMPARGVYQSREFAIYMPPKEGESLTSRGMWRRDAITVSRTERPGYVIGSWRKGTDRIPTSPFPILSTHRRFACDNPPGGWNCA